MDILLSFDDLSDELDVPRWYLLNPTEHANLRSILFFKDQLYKFRSLAARLRTAASVDVRPRHITSCLRVSRNSRRSNIRSSLSICHDT